MVNRHCPCSFLRSGRCLGGGERKAEACHLRKQDENLRLLLEATPDLIAFKDAEGRYLDVNDSFAALFGRDEAQIVGKRDSELDDGGPESSFFRKEPFSDQGAWREARQTRETCKVLDGQGRNRIFDVIKIPLFDGDGTPRRLLVMGREVTERAAVLGDLVEQRRRLREVERIAGMGYWAFFPDEDRLDWDDGSAAILRGTPSDLAPSVAAFRARIHPDDLQDYLEALVKLREAGHFRCCFRFLRPDGRWVHLCSQGVALFDDDGRIVRVEGYIQDVTADRAREKELLLAATIFDHAVEGICITDGENRIVSVNPAFSAITGYSLDEVLGEDPRILKSDRHPKSFYEDFWRVLLSEGRWQGEIWNRRKSGETYPEWISVSVVRHDDGTPQNFIAVFRDLSALSFRDSGIMLPSYSDPLTQLPNKSLFVDRVSQELAEAKREERHFGVVCLDLDRFKNLNDSFGHFLGDQFLQQVAQRLLERSSPTDTVARFGGDEFGILVREARTASDVAQRADSFLRVFRRPFDLDGRSVFISASAGVSLYPEDGGDVDTLLRKADLAMYRAKELGGNQTSFFTEELGARTSRRMQLETHLRQALVRGEFELFYQPLIHLVRRNLTSLEALIRWNHPTMGFTPPAEFIDLAEETGLIIPLGDWIMKAVCSQLRRWRDEGLSDFRIAINLSPRQFNRPGLVDHLCRVLEEERLRPDDIELEITEGTVIADDGSAMETLKELRRRGFRIFIDDFGTGYSSLSYLLRLPVTGIKVDQSFIRGMADDPAMRAIVKAIIDMGLTLGLEIVAEGVEDDEELALLRDMGCPVVQGYWLTPPVSPEKVRPYLDRGRRF